MKKLNLASLSFLFCLAQVMYADNITISQTSGNIYLNQELLDYLPAVKGQNEPVVGYNALDIGWGSGNGIDEIFATSFIFNPLVSVNSAFLTLNLTPKGTTTDELLFADNQSVRGEGYLNACFYGNPYLKNLPNDVTTSITFNLLSMPFTDPLRHEKGVVDLSNLLLDGDLHFVYADDAIIHSATLMIDGTLYSNTPVPTPESDAFPLLFIGLFIVFLAGSKHKTGIFSRIV
jgi:hypothetical protein